jgi:hypothetical protein
MLDAVHHPTLSMKGASMDIDPASMKNTRTSEGTLRGTLENALRARRTRFLFIDEAQHARYVSKDAMGGSAVLDSWKCLAADVDLVLVIVGAYPLLGILHNSPHIVGRKSQVHLPRYLTTPDDVAEFGRILAHYDHLVDLEPGCITLLDHAQLLYEGSIGCIGLLKKWLLHASALALARSELISLSLLKETRPPDADISAIAREIAQGEQYLEKSGIIELPTGKNEDWGSDEVRKANNRRPFQKKPRRLKAGNRNGPNP